MPIENIKITNDVKLSEHDFRRLLKWQRRMVVLFLGTWVYILFVIAIDVLFQPLPSVIQLAFIPALGLVVGGVWLQFSVRCPFCGYRLGRQSRLVVPDHCRSCGTRLRRPQG